MGDKISRKLLHWGGSSKMGRDGNPKPFQQKQSSAESSWKWRKTQNNLSYETIKIVDELMDLVGLEEMKMQVLDIINRVEVAKRQGIDLEEERLNMIFQGNPGTGKTTVARIYAKFLQSVGVLSSNCFLEWSGAKMIIDGPIQVQKKIEEMLQDDNNSNTVDPSGGGVIFIDEAYQLTAPHMSSSGRAILDVLLTEIENNTGKLIMIFAGYEKDMQSFIEHNEGIRSRVPYTLHFDDFSEFELWSILGEKIKKKFNGKMEIEGSLDGLYMRIAIRRLAKGRGKRGFGNARQVENLLARIRARQARRLTAEERAGRRTDDFLFTKEDLIGPPPSRALDSAALAQLTELIGLDAVKSTVKGIISTLEWNYERELQELRPIDFNLNRVFLGSPGTGKTTVAKLYGQILAEIGLLSDGEVVVKNPSDFIGSAVGMSEEKTRQILAATVGKVLVIDEAYMLYSGKTDGNNESYKTGVIDTIVAEVQGVPGEDRCILLLGYEDRIKDMFQHVNDGLARRFRIEDAFRFEEFNGPQLEEILSLQLKQQDLEASLEAIAHAVDLLNRSKARKNYSNAGEVVNLLEKAKINFQTRQDTHLRKKMGSRILLQPVDFDENYGSAVDTVSNCCKTLQGLVNQEIIGSLDRIFKPVEFAKASGRSDAIEMVPTVFIFKGPPGSGKTTAAREMGKFVRAVGLFSSDEVIECTVSDMVGRYVGETRPKTKALVERSLGKVMFVKDAACLAGHSYEAEAADELESLLRRYAGRNVVILSGGIKAMDHLLKVRPGISGLSVEPITFRHLTAEECMTLLHRELQSRGFEAPFLKDSSAGSYKTLHGLFDSLSEQRSWSNARDIKTLEKNMRRMAIATQLDLSSSGIATHFHRKRPVATSTKTLSADQAISCVEAMIKERTTTSTDEEDQTQTSLLFKDFLMRGSPHAFAIPEEAKMDQASRRNSLSSFRTNNIEAPRPQTSYRPSKPEERRPQTSSNRRKNEEIQTSEGILIDLLSKPMKRNPVHRDVGVTDEVWNELQETKLNEENAVGQRSRKETKHLKNVLKKLRKMGVCQYGYNWYQVAGGWRCAAGACFVSDSELVGSGGNQDNRSFMQGLYQNFKK